MVARASQISESIASYVFGRILCMRPGKIEQDWGQSFGRGIWSRRKQYCSSRN
jgi:hypothetical protein